MKKIRLKYIDIARAFAIIFIVLGHTLVHSEHCDNIYKFLYSFHVLLFFILSGYLFFPVKDKKRFFQNKFLRIMVPYFAWAFLFLIPYILLGQTVGESLNTNSSFQLMTQIKNVLYGNGNLAALKQNSALWFLPALFVINLFFGFTVKDKTNWKVDVMYLILLFIIGFISSNTSLFIFPWGINTLLNVGVFFYLGYLLKKYDLFQKEKLFKIGYMIIFFIIGYLGFYFNYASIACIDYTYGNYMLMSFSGFSLSIVVIYISFLIKENRLLEYIGRNTMGILVFHKLIILIFQTKLGIISELLRNSNIWIELLISIIIVILSIVTSLVATFIVKKICPLLLGETKQR